MLGQYTELSVAYLTKRKGLFWLCLLAVVGFLLVGISRLKIDNDFYSVFPRGKEFSSFNKILAENNLNKQLTFSFRSSDDLDQNSEHLEHFRALLIEHFPTEISHIQLYRQVDELALINYLQSASIAHLDSSDYEKIRHKINTDSLSEKLKGIKQQLTGPNSFFLASYFAKDPLGLLSQKMNTFRVESDSSTYAVEDGVVYSADKKRVFFFADLEVSSSDSKKLKQFDSDLHKLLSEQETSLDIDVFGIYQVSLANIEQIRKDTFLASALCLSLILILLISYYRSVSIPFFFLLPTLFGMLSGLGLTGFFHPEINAISIATASVLLGIALDYSFHFYTHYKHSGNLLQTVRQIVSPMLLGNFTTIIAFMALLYTRSTILQDFGRIALFTLLGTALFTLFALPVILSNKKFPFHIKRNEKLEKKISPFVFRILLFFTVGFTAFCLLKAQGINFDSDIRHLAYHPSFLKEKEKQYTGIHPQHEKRLSIFAYGKTIEQAKQTSEAIYEHLTDKKELLGLSEILSPSPYLISEDRWNTKQKEWHNFWAKHSNIKSELTLQASTLGFSAKAFTPFFKSIDSLENIQKSGEELLTQLGMQALVHSGETNYSIITSVITPLDKLDDLKVHLNAIPNVFVFDMGDITSEMLTLVQEDFNFLLYFSSLLVFVSLLVVYGRIELAIFAFFPMLLAWIWILGFTSLFGISFNFVNIIITTFIFGLGDDFSIFITDGLIQKYRTNRNSLHPYKSAIIMSGITTIIGTGVLIFAGHPAIHSIALVSVIGISTILGITLYIQPGIFQWLITNRVERKQNPITFFNALYTFIIYVLFTFWISLLFIFLTLFIFLFPLKKRKKQVVSSYLLSFWAKITCLLALRKNIKKFYSEQNVQGSIIISNHSSFLDIVILLSLFPRSKMMVKRWVYTTPILRFFIRYFDYLPAEEGIDEHIIRAKKHLNDGYSIIIFPEGTRSKSGDIQRFHKGAFALSKRLDVPILPVLLVGMHEINKKHDQMIRFGTIFIEFLAQIRPIQDENERHYMLRVQAIMREQFIKNTQQHLTIKHWTPFLIQNYIFKGSILEWYVRIKLRLEQTNFLYYDSLIGDRAIIYDIGCGYGYLSYYLHYRNSQRQITGIDYDEDKILTAQHAIKKNNNIDFKHIDIKKFEFSPCDTVIFHDVLHYLSPEEQQVVLQKAVNSLTKNGLLLIRDTITDTGNCITTSKRIEWFSTQFFRFNKTKNNLYFLTIRAIQHIATENHLTMNILPQSKRTSSLLFILKKEN